MPVSLVLTAIVSALAGGVIVALAWAVTALSGRLTALTTINAELLTRLTNLERVDRNPLYQESMEDLRARQLRAADSAAVGVEHMLNAIRLLAPEMLKKGKSK